MSGRIKYELSTSVYEEYTFHNQCTVIVSDTLSHRVTTRDRNGIKTVVQERIVRLPFRHDIWQSLPLSFAGLGESLLGYMALVPDCPPDLWQDIVDSILSYVRRAHGDLMVGAFRAHVDVELYTEEEAEPGSFPRAEDAATCSICKGVLWSHRGLIKTPCGHAFHTPCAIPLLKNFPLCPRCGYSLES